MASITILPTQSATVSNSTSSGVPYDGGFSQSTGDAQYGGAPSFSQASGTLSNGTYTPPPTQAVAGASTGGGNSMPAPGTNPYNVGQIVNGQRWNGNGWDATTAQGPSQDEINKAIDDTYNASKSYLDQAEQNVNTDYPTVQQDIQGQYDTGTNQLGSAHTSDVNLLGQQQDKADYSKESALAASRRLYSEVRQGYQQRFGGSSSAGEAGNDLANVEQQRQQGQTQRGYQDTTQTLNNHKLDVENQYNNGLKELAVQKNTSLNQANRDFQNKLLQISQTRAQNEQAKGQARLQALQDLRNQVFSINQQNTQFQQSLEAMRQQAGLQLQNYMALSGAGAGGVANQLAAYSTAASTNPTTQLAAGGQGYQQQQAPVGHISNGMHRNPDGTMSY